MDHIFKHLWLQQESLQGFVPHPYPSTPTLDTINMDIVTHIVHSMRLEKTSEVRVAGWEL